MKSIILLSIQIIVLSVGVQATELPAQSSDFPGYIKLSDGRPVPIGSESHRRDAQRPFAEPRVANAYAAYAERKRADMKWRENFEEQLARERRNRPPPIDNTAIDQSNATHAKALRAIYDAGRAHRTETEMLIDAQTLAMSRVPYSLRTSAIDGTWNSNRVFETFKGAVLGDLLTLVTKDGLSTSQLKDIYLIMAKTYLSSSLTDTYEDLKPHDVRISAVRDILSFPNGQDLVLRQTEASAARYNEISSTIESFFARLDAGLYDEGARLLTVDAHDQGMIRYRAEIARGFLFGSLGFSIMMETALNDSIYANYYLKDPKQRLAIKSQWDQVKRFILYDPLLVTTLLMDPAFDTNLPEKELAESKRAFAAEKAYVLRTRDPKVLDFIRQWQNESVFNTNEIFQRLSSQFSHQNEKQIRLFGFEPKAQWNETPLTSFQQILFGKSAMLKRIDKISQEQAGMCVRFYK